MIFLRSDTLEWTAAAARRRRPAPCVLMSVMSWCGKLPERDGARPARIHRLTRGHATAHGGVVSTGRVRCRQDTRARTRLRSCALWRLLRTPTAYSGSAPSPLDRASHCRRVTALQHGDLPLVLGFAQHLAHEGALGTVPLELLEVALQQELVVPARRGDGKGACMHGGRDEQRVRR